MQISSARKFKSHDLKGTMYSLQMLQMSIFVAKIQIALKHSYFHFRTKYIIGLFDFGAKIQTKIGFEYLNIFWTENFVNLNRKEQAEFFKGIGDWFLSEKQKKNSQQQKPLRVNHTFIYPILLIVFVLVFLYCSKLVFNFLKFQREEKELRKLFSELGYELSKELISLGFHPKKGESWRMFLKRISSHFEDQDEIQHVENLCYGLENEIYGKKPQKSLKEDWQKFKRILSEKEKARKEFIENKASGNQA